MDLEQELRAIVAAVTHEKNGYHGAPGGPGYYEVISKETSSLLRAILFVQNSLPDPRSIDELWTLAEPRAGRLLHRKGLRRLPEPLLRAFLLVALSYDCYRILERDCLRRQPAAWCVAYYVESFCEGLTLAEKASEDASSYPAPPSGGRPKQLEPVVGHESGVHLYGGTVDETEHQSAQVRSEGGQPWRHPGERNFNSAGRRRKPGRPKKEIPNDLLARYEQGARARGKDPDTLKAPFKRGAAARMPAEQERRDDLAEITADLYANGGSLEAIGAVIGRPKPRVSELLARGRELNRTKLSA